MNKALAKEVVDWISQLLISEGSRAGQNFLVLPFQKKFIIGLVDNVEASLTIARGNGKTTLTGALGACALRGPLAAPRAQVIIVAASLGQARIAFEHAAWFLKPMIEAEGRACWRVINNTHDCRIEYRPTGTVLRAIGSDPKRAHGLAPKIIIADEPAQWPRNEGDRMRAAMVTALGKHLDSKFISIGTRSDDELHWFSKTLYGGGRGVYSQIHAAHRDDNDFSAATINKANPALPHLPELKKEVYRFRDNARDNGGSDLMMYRALRLNKGTPDTFDVRPIVTVEEWDAVVTDPPPVRKGPCFVGFDIGGTASMTAAVAYWPETGRMEVRGAFPSRPRLETRSKNDGVGQLYPTMKERGDIWVLPGIVTPVGEFLRRFAHTLDGVEVELAQADRYRDGEAKQAMAEAEVGWPMDWRPVGAGPDGTRDIRAFQAEVICGHLRPAPGLLMQHAIAESAVEYTVNDGLRLDKTRRRGRIDALQAAVLAVAAGRRWRLPNLDDDSLSSFYNREAATVIGV